MIRSDDSEPAQIAEVDPEAAGASEMTGLFRFHTEKRTAPKSTTALIKMRAQDRSATVIRNRSERNALSLCFQSGRSTDGK